MTDHILAIDPGPVESAWVIYGDGTVLRCAKEPNNRARDRLGLWSLDCRIAIEMIASYGMAVGREVFETCLWIGRYTEYAGEHRVQLVYRRDVKLHLCNSARAKDANVRAALIDRFGPGKSKAIGTKAKQGPLYGVHGDCWAALAVAVTVADGACAAASARGGGA